jgi:hypothetical protein
MAALEQFAPRYVGDFAQFISSWSAPTAFAVLHDMDSGNINPASTVLGDEETSTPTAYVAPRTPHIHWLFGLTGVLGKRPIVTVNNSNRFLSTAMLASWNPVFSYDQITWTPFDTPHVALTGPVRVQFQHSEAFTSDTVYIADHPVFRFADFQTLATQLATNSSGLVMPSNVGNSAGVIGTTQAELGPGSRIVGNNPIWGFRFNDPSVTTTDGGPRREIIITCGIHAGEVIDGWFLKGILDWYLNGSGTKHARFRANFRLLVYFALTPNGRRAGNYRVNPTRSTDPNRDWLSFSLNESRIVRDAILADAVRGDVHIDLHSSASRDLDVHVYTPPSPTGEEVARQAAFKAAFDAADSGTMASSLVPLTDAVANTTSTGFSRRTYGSFAVLSEPGTRRARTAARDAEIGAHYTEAIVTMDEDGAWWSDDGLALIANVGATGTVTADLQASASHPLAAVVTASGTVSASLSGGILTVSGLLCPALAMADRYTPGVMATARLTPVVTATTRLAMGLSLASRCGAPMAIDPEIYADNDANLAITDLPTGLTVQWGVVALGVGGDPPGPSVALDSINAAVSGNTTETGTKPAWMTAKGLPDSSTGIYYTAVLEGAAITAHLLGTYEDEQVALVAKSGQDARVYGLTTVKAAKLANA